MERDIATPDDGPMVVYHWNDVTGYRNETVLRILREVDGPRSLWIADHNSTEALDDEDVLRDGGDTYDLLKVRELVTQWARSFPGEELELEGYDTLGRCPHLDVTVAP
jgi:hypothetical protein